MTLRAFVLLAFLTPGLCFAQVRTPTGSTTATQLDELRKQIEGLRRDVEAQKQLVSRLNLRILQAEFARDRHKTIDLDVTTLRQFQRIDDDTGAGVFFVSVQEVTPYLDGYKLTLDIGNPQSGTYSGLKLKVRWAKKYDWQKYEAASHDKWEKSIQEKELTFTNNLLPGTWNKIEIVLSPAKNDELGFLQVSLSTDSVSFNRR